MNEETIKLTVELADGESLTLQAVGFKKEDEVLVVTTLTTTYVIVIANIAMYWFVTPEKKPDASEED